MSYRDDFYTLANVIGYTGVLNDNPTFYFRHGTEFGRITQWHRDIGNIGRNIVRSAPDYVIEQGRVAREYYNGKYRHTSRNPFVTATPNDPVFQAAVNQAIANHPSIKPKHLLRLHPNLPTADWGVGEPGNDE